MFYFTYSQTPELRQLASQQRRDAVHSLAWRQLRSAQPQLWVRSFVIVVACAVIACGVSAAIDYAFSLSISASWAGAIGAGIGALLHINLMASSLRPYYANIIAEAT